MGIWYSRKGCEWVQEEGSLSSISLAASATGSWAEPVKSMDLTKSLEVRIVINLSVCNPRWVDLLDPSLKR